MFNSATSILNRLGLMPQRGIGCKTVESLHSLGRMPSSEGSCHDADEAQKSEDVSAERLQCISRDIKLAKLFFKPSSKCNKTSLNVSEFECLRLVGEGSFGNVVQTRANRRSYAVKVLPRDDPCSLNELQVTRCWALFLFNLLYL